MYTVQCYNNRSTRSNTQNRRSLESDLAEYSDIETSIRKLGQILEFQLLNRVLPISPIVVTLIYNVTANQTFRL